MRQECKSENEENVLNDKLLSFLIEIHRLKRYEDDKKNMVKNNDQVQVEFKN